MAPDEDATANVFVAAFTAPTAPIVGGGTCAIEIASDGAPITVEALMTADAGSLVTAVIWNCVSDKTSSVTLTTGWVRAAIDAAH